MDELNSTQGIVAVAAAGAGVVALLFCIVLAFKVRRLRSAQRMVLGNGEADIVGHASSLQDAFVQLRDWVEETAAGLEERVGWPSSAWTAAWPTPRWCVTTP